MKESTIAVAAYIIKKHNSIVEKDDQAVKMNVKRLEKLLYFCDKEYNEKYNKNIIEDKFENWGNGPVLPQLYYGFRHLSAEGALVLIASWHNLNINDENKVQTIDYVLQQTKYITTENLIELAKNYYINYSIKKDKTAEF